MDEPGLYTEDSGHGAVHGIPGAGLGARDLHRLAQSRLSLLEIMEDHWGRTATIIVSQRPDASWYDTLGEPTIADAICDRLFSNSETIELKGDSLRRFPPEA